MILTFKVKHGRNFSRELVLAKRVAEYAVKNGAYTSKDVRHFGLNSVISGQLIRKYCRNKMLKRVNRVKLIVPGQAISVRGDVVHFACGLNLDLPIRFPGGFSKINQVEVGETYAYVSATYENEPLFEPVSFFGVDLNATGHCLVASNPTTGKVLKLGRKAYHVHEKYRGMRRNLQKKGKYRKVKRIRNRESRIVRDLNHRISSKLVKTCEENKSGIVLEDLKRIKRAKFRKRQRHSLNSWSFYQLRQMIEYKSKKLGVPVYRVDPRYTSQRCSRCGHTEKANRNGKSFLCKSCGKGEDADVNAGFNIAYAHQEGITQFVKDRDLAKGSTDAPKEAMA